MSDPRTLKQRLRGRYPVGPILPDGKPFPLIQTEAADRIEELERLIERRDDWIDVEVEMPPDNTAVLVACADWPFATMGSKKVPVKTSGWDAERKRWQVFGASWTPTHWMHHPEPPPPRKE